jgi:hypothetical protein
MAQHKSERLKRLHRVKQIEKMMILQLPLEDMAIKLGVNERTIRRDIEWRYEQLVADGGKEVASHRAALLSELGRLYAETIQDCNNARQNGNETFPYLNSRIRAMSLMAKLTGAEVPSKILLQGQIEHRHEHTGKVEVQMVSEEEMLEMHRVHAQILMEAPRFQANGNGNGQGHN